MAMHNLWFFQFNAVRSPKTWLIFGAILKRVISPLCVAEKSAAHFAALSIKIHPRRYTPVSKSANFNETESQYDFSLYQKDKLFGRSMPHSPQITVKVRLYIFVLTV